MKAASAKSSGDARNILGDNRVDSRNRIELLKQGFESGANHAGSAGCLVRENEVVVDVAIATRDVVGTATDLISDRGLALQAAAVARVDGDPFAAE